MLKSFSIPAAVNNNPRAMGLRIKRGLEELGDLDATSSANNLPHRKKNRKETENTCDYRNEEKVVECSLNDAPSSSSSAEVVPHVFSWKWDDWREAKRAAFSTTSSPSDKRQFIYLCSLWHARVRSGEKTVPPYVQATELLVCAMLIDQENIQPNRIICQSYAAALSRLVHVMTGTFVRDGGLDTYRKRAKQIGLPEEAVEVRQRFAHGSVPHITELRWVAAMVMQFLFHNYWSEQEAEIQQMEQQDAEKKKFRKNSLNRENDLSNENEYSPTPLLQDERKENLSITEIKEFLKSMSSVEEKDHLSHVNENDNLITADNEHKDVRFLKCSGWIVQ